MGGGSRDATPRRRARPADCTRPGAAPLGLRHHQRRSNDHGSNSAGPARATTGLSDLPGYQVDSPYRVCHGVPVHPLSASPVFPALVHGVGAGLAVALPLGAIGVLLLHEGLTRGWRVAAAGATGVALVDLGYVVLALTAGTIVAGPLTAHTRTVHVLGAGVLTSVAVWGLAGLRSSPAPDVAAATDPVLDAVPDDPADGDSPGGGRPSTPGSEPDGDPGPASEPDGGPGAGRGPGPGPARVLARFVALTAVNPLTAVYFLALAAALGGIVRGTAAAAAFAAGVFLASWGWALTLTGIGAAAGTRLPDWARPALSVAGYTAVLGYAAHLLLTG
jgi:arginine exporter protein ArgO